MPSLVDIPEVIGFFSYSREDDEAFEGTLSALRDGIQRELSAQLGRSKTNFRVWQDQQAIAPGQLWESEIKVAVEQAVFFIPIVTPRAVNSHHCKFEFEAFLSREQALGRADLVFPILYIGVPALENEALWRQDPVLAIIGVRQYVDWRPLRHLDVRTTAVREAIERFCSKVVEALRKPWVSPEERRKQHEIKAEQRHQTEQGVTVERWRTEPTAEPHAREHEPPRRTEVSARLRTEAMLPAEEEKERTEVAQRPDETKRPVEARLADDEPQQAQAVPRQHRGRDGPKIQRFWERELKCWEREFLPWARTELHEKFGVSNSALSAEQAKEQLERRGYRISWSLLFGYTVQLPEVRDY